MPEIIKYEVQDLKNQKIKENLGGRIEFYTKHVRYKLKFVAQEPNDDEDLGLGLSTVERDYECIFWIKDITAIEKEWRQDVKLWLLQIQVSGVAGDPRFYFKKESDCENLRNKFMSYVDARFFKEESSEV